MPDLHVEVEDVVVAGEPGRERVTLRWHLSGTHTGEPFVGIAATGRPVHLYGMDLLDFEDGRIAGNCIYFDQLSFARQVGMLPPEGIAARPVVDRCIQLCRSRAQASAPQQLNTERNPNIPRSRRKSE